jgi:hypothetical protein
MDTVVMPAVKVKKNPAAVALGKARVAKLTKAQLSTAGRKAANARWKKARL